MYYCLVLCVFLLIFHVCYECFNSSIFKKNQCGRNKCSWSPVLNDQPGLNTQDSHTKVANPSLTHINTEVSLLTNTTGTISEGLEIHGIGNTSTSNLAINPWARATFKQKLPLYSTSNDAVSNGFSYLQYSWNFSLLLISLERYIFLLSFLS